MYTMKDTVSVRISGEELKEVENLSDEEKRKKSEILREVLRKGIMQKKLEIAFRKFQDNEATAWKAARIADIPLTSFLDALAKRNIEFHYSVEDFREDVKDLI